MEKNVEHKFWKTQPIDTSKKSIENKEIETINIELVEKNPYKLPDKFEWYEFDMNTDTDIIYNFLLSYYADNPDVKSRFHYSKEFLKWFLMPPNYYKDLLVGIKFNNKIVATIFGIPMTIKLHDKVVKMIEINFLCIHNNLRNKRLAPVLIKEITRRTNLHGIFQAFYTTGIDLPNTLLYANYYHRPLNIPKLIDLNMLGKPEKISLSGYSRLFKTLETININIRKIEEKDYEICCKLLNEFHQQFKISILFSQEEFNNHFIFRENVIESYVVENNNKITDFVSFYYIPSKISNNEKHAEMKRAYVYYYFNTHTDLVKLIDNGLYFMKQNQVDIVNCIKQYNNDKFIDKLKFLEGNAGLNFYLFNWSSPPIVSSDMAVVMV